MDTYRLYSKRLDGLHFILFAGLGCTIFLRATFPAIVPDVVSKEAAVLCCVSTERQEAEEKSNSLFERKVDLEEAILAEINNQELSPESMAIVLTELLWKYKNNPTDKKLFIEASEDELNLYKEHLVEREFYEIGWKECLLNIDLRVEWDDEKKELILGKHIQHLIKKERASDGLMGDISKPFVGVGVILGKSYYRTGFIKRADFPESYFILEYNEHLAPQEDFLCEEKMPLGWRRCYYLGEGAICDFAENVEKWDLCYQIDRFQEDPQSIPYQKMHHYQALRFLQKFLPR